MNEVATLTGSTLFTYIATDHKVHTLETLGMGDRSVQFGLDLCYNTTSGGLNHLLSKAPWLKNHKTTTRIASEAITFGLVVGISAYLGFDRVSIPSNSSFAEIGKVAADVGITDIALSLATSSVLFHALAYPVRRMSNDQRFSSLGATVSTVGLLTLPSFKEIASEVIPSNLTTDLLGPAFSSAKEILSDSFDASIVAVPIAYNYILNSIDTLASNIPLLSDLPQKRNLIASVITASGLVGFNSYFELGLSPQLIGASALCSFAFHQTNLTSKAATWTAVSLGLAFTAVSLDLAFVATTLEGKDLIDDFAAGNITNIYNAFSTVIEENFIQTHLLPFFTYSLLTETTSQCIQSLGILKNYPNQRTLIGSAAAAVALWASTPLNLGLALELLPKVAFTHFLAKVAFSSGSGPVETTKQVETLELQEKNSTTTSEEEEEEINDTK